MARMCAKFMTLWTLAAAACGGEATKTPAAADASAGADATATGHRTLATCATTVGAGVPAFYKKYFRCVDLAMDAGDVVIKTQDLPPHPSAYYAPNDPDHVVFDTQGGVRHQNPNQIAVQALTVRIPSQPVAKGLTIDKTLVDGQAGGKEEYTFGQTGAAGVALDGVALFHGVAAPGDDLKKEAEGFDGYEGHPQNTGVYHYHSPSPGPLEVLKVLGLATTTVPGQAEVELYGVMCDGTLMLGCTELDGKVPDGKDFDAQNGHVGDIAEGGTVYFAQRYHTHVCPAKFPADPFAPEIQYYTACGSVQGQGGKPQTCKTTADCTEICGPKGCTCAANKEGTLACLPACTEDADCPTQSGALQCDKAKGMCVPK